MKVVGNRRRSPCLRSKPDGPKSWMQKARELDLRRGTQLGTLGYLLPEIRRQIWKIFFAFVLAPPGIVGHEYKEEWNQVQRATDLPFKPQIFWDFGIAEDIFALRSYSIRIVRNSNRYKNKDSSSNTGSSTPSMTWYRERFGYGILKNPLLASRTIRFELETLFLSMHQFSFDTPYTLERFCGLLPDDRREYLRHIIIWAGRRYLFLNEQDTDDHHINAWERAIRKLPSSIRTSLIRTGGDFGSQEQELRTIRVISQTLREVAPETTIKPPAKLSTSH